MDASDIDVDGRRVSAAERFVSEWVGEHRIPGATLAVFDADHAAGFAFGARDLRENTPATPDTLIGIGSCTKSFTGVAILQLAEAGDLAVTDDVSAYVPHLRDASGPPVTIRELLTHSSGMPSDGMATALIGRAMDVDDTEVPLSSDEDFARHVGGSVDERVLGLDDPFFYYNSGFTLLGEVVEAVSGRAYAEYVREEIQEPLGMERSTFRRERFESDGDTMTPYYRREGSIEEGRFPFDRPIHAPGGLLSSVMELSRYGRMQLNDGSFRGERILPADRIEESRTPVSTRERLLGGTEQRYAYGWMVREFLGDTLVGHGGGIGVYNAYLGYLKNRGLGVALLCTTGPRTHPMHAGPAVLALLADEDPIEAVPHYALEERLPVLTGTYESYRGVQSLEVTRLGGGLRVVDEDDGLGGMELALVPEDLGAGVSTFRTVDAGGNDVTVRFEVGDDSVDMYLQRWRLHRPRT
ncbi:serine hydrolase [Salinirubellus sp. GCM10025818]|uniref:serine hydrolase n=1 Tax=Salinirubellus TaxID=2162630 RepID=UPI0030D0E7BD